MSLKFFCASPSRDRMVAGSAEMMRLAATNDKPAIRDLEWINDLLRAADRLADQTGRLFRIDDPTGAEPEVFAALSVVDGHFRKDRPARGRTLRSGLGLPGERLRATKKAAQKDTRKDARRSLARIEAAEKKTAQRAAIGYFAAEMAARFRKRGYGPCDDLIADLELRRGLHLDGGSAARPRRLSGAGIGLELAAAHGGPSLRFGSNPAGGAETAFYGRSTPVSTAPSAHVRRA